MSPRNRSLPLIYSCSGCSSAAQMANYLAVQLDFRGFAEMSCIAGVGGNVSHLVQIAKSGRLIIAVDGCPLQCVKQCLGQRGVEPERHVLLYEHGVKKRYGSDFDHTVADRILNDTLIDLATSLRHQVNSERQPTENSADRIPDKFQQTGCHPA